MQKESHELNEKYTRDNGFINEEKKLLLKQITDLN